MNPASSLDPAFLHGTAGIALAAVLTVVVIMAQRPPARRRELALCLVAFCALAPLAGANFAVGDRLFDVRAQLLIDVIMVVFGAAIAVELARCRATSALLLALRATAIFIIVVFGVALPAAYGIIFGLKALGVPTAESGLTFVSPLAAAISAVVAVLNYRASIAKAA
jgi:hypothetical protein